VDDEPRAVRANPIDLFGEDVVRVGAMAVGLGAAAFVNDKLLHPIVSNLVPGISTGQTGAKLMDAATTAVSAWGIGEAVGVLDRRIGRDMKIGGLILSGGKVLSIPFPGFAISASVPGIPGIHTPAALPAGQAQSGSGAKQVVINDKVFTDYPRPIAASEDVGL
jgi:hypothetical protein